MRLQGKTAIVTGAARGIGRATAVAFAAEGSEVFGVDLDPAPLAGISDRIQPVALDVTDAGAIERLRGEVGAVHVLFNCAGIVQSGTVLDADEDDWAAGFSANVGSMYRMIRAFLPGMLDAGGGSIINMASVVSSISGVPNRFVYGTTKAAVIGLTKAVAADFVSRGVRCNAIAPGTVDTPSLADRLAATGDADRALAEFVARQPMGRLGRPEEIAAIAVYLASDESAYTTGSVFVSDGGMTL